MVGMGETCSKPTQLRLYHHFQLLEMSSFVLSEVAAVWATGTKFTTVDLFKNVFYSYYLTPELGIHQNEQLS